MKPDISITIHSDIKYIPYALALVNSYSKTVGFNKDNCKKITISVEEALTNIIKYSYKNKKKEIIVLELIFTKKNLEIKLKHKGKGFNLAEYECKDIEQLKKERKRGGFGIFLIKEFMDELKVEENAEWKYYLMRKRLAE